MFEQVNKAYEFLCSKSRLVEGPDPQNIVLILRAQSILFNRYKSGKVSHFSTRSIQNMRVYTHTFWGFIYIHGYQIFIGIHVVKLKDLRIHKYIGSDVSDKVLCYIFYCNEHLICD